MNNLFQGAAGIFFVGLFILGYFPGGTIFMAVMCDSHRLDGWDWVLSVIIPFFGLFTALTC